MTSMIPQRMVEIFLTCSLRGPSVVPPGNLSFVTRTGGRLIDEETWAFHRTKIRYRSHVSCSTCRRDSEDYALANLSYRPSTTCSALHVPPEVVASCRNHFNSWWQSPICTWLTPANAMYLLHRRSSSAAAAAVNNFA